MKVTIVSFMVLIFLAGCGSSRFKTELVVEDLAPKPSDYKCNVYNLVLPDCQHATVGRIFMSPQSVKSSGDHQEALNMLVNHAVVEAKRIGGDAVVHLMLGSGGEAYLHGTEPFLAAEVIVFEDQDCDRNVAGSFAK